MSHISVGLGIKIDLHVSTYFIQRNFSAIPYAMCLFFICVVRWEKKRKIQLPQNSQNLNFSHIVTANDAKKKKNHVEKIDE